ncbi:signal peptidase II [Arthrobacter citreus]|uniref:signal peptidase II n=1 Tax=Arthrobacter TaxID=1663 RepID=UPI00126536B9|nr:signal peptidase II [Arthrobacter gandavensis]
MSSETAGPAGTPSRPDRRLRTVLLVWAAFLAAADLAVKTAAEALLTGGTVIDLGVVNFRLLYNPGVAFSLGAALPDWVIIAVTGMIIAGMTWYVLTSAPTMTWLSRAGAGMLLGGATGNFIDRLDGRGVVDYLHTGWFPTFNLADVFVTTGVAVFILGTLLRACTSAKG